MRRLLVALLSLLSSTVLAFDHGQWDQLLDRHVTWQRGGVASAVDYAGMSADNDTLNAYLEALSAVTPEAFQSFTREKKLAFLINAYNAFTVSLILRQDPLPDSIRDIGSLFSGPWDQRFAPLLGEKRTLDEIEHEMIRGNATLMDARIHFAVNCASVGCPALRPEAYRADKLEQQLADNTRRFLRDRQRNRYDEQKEVLEISHLFDWYESDFEDEAGSLSAYLLRYADELALPGNARKRLADARLAIRFLPYDWSLNKQGEEQ